MSKQLPKQLAKAVALFYDGETAPRVSAKGSGDIAEEIIRIAKEHDIPLHEDRDLLVLLSQLELGDEIPRSLYVAIAEIIAFAYMLKGKVPRNWDARTRQD